MHVLTRNKYTQLLQSNGHIFGLNKELIDNIVSHKIKPYHIMGLIASCSRSYENVSFNSKDMYNHICRVRKGLTMDGNAMDEGSTINLIF